MTSTGAANQWLGGDVRYAHGSKASRKAGEAVLVSDDDADGEDALTRSGKSRWAPCRWA